MDLETAKKMAVRYLPCGTTYVCNNCIVRKNSNSVIYLFDVKTEQTDNDPVAEDLEALRLNVIQDVSCPFFEAQGYYWQLGANFLKGSKRKTKPLPNKLGSAD
jgi:hypothetical protein